jgi:hypothetical protein
MRREGSNSSLPISLSLDGRGLRMRVNYRRFR